MTEANEKREYLMSEEARRAAREYKRKWREKNPERAKEINREYWARRAKREQEAQEGGENEKS